MVHIGNDWDEVLKEEFESENYKKIRETLKEEYSAHVVFPSMYDIFNAFKLTPFSAVKVVILGQDPYHERGQAHGLSFSVPEGVRQPPSLVNILKAIKEDVGASSSSQNGCLIPWAKQGVLLLNTTLTVREGRANSHKDIGWQVFTDHVIQKLNENPNPVVYLLWGANARAKKQFLSNPAHLVLESVHPSPLSAHYGFFENHHFSRANQFLQENGVSPIDWSL